MWTVQRPAREACQGAWKLCLSSPPLYIRWTVSFWVHAVWMAPCWLVGAAWLSSDPVQMDEEVRMGLQSRGRMSVCVACMQAPGGGLWKRWWVLALSSGRIRSRPHGGAGIWVEKWLKELVSFDVKKRKLRASKTADFLKSQKSIPVDWGIGLLWVFLKTSLKLLYLDGFWQPPFDSSEWCTCPPVLPTGLSSLEDSCVPWIWAGVLTGPNTAKHLLEELGQRFRN